MAKPVTHLSKVRMIGPDSCITGTLCNRMSNAGDDINCTTEQNEVTCKLCIRNFKLHTESGLTAAPFPFPLN
jgi:hypothetical protein